jgi:hypothetical protein
MSKRERFLNLDDPKSRMRWSVKLLKAAEMVDGCVNKIPPYVGISRITVIRYLTHLELWDEIDELRANRPKKVYEVTRNLTWKIKYAPAEAVKIITESIWRNDGITGAVAADLKVSIRTVQYWKQKFDLYRVFRRAKAAREKKLEAGVAEYVAGFEPKDLHVFKDSSD